MGPGTEAIRVHQDSAGDAVARAHGAEAVSSGRDVFFRAGRFQPNTAKGFGLLAHEATHVLQAMRPGAAWRRATKIGVQEEEREADQVERIAGNLRRTTGSISPESSAASRVPRPAAAKAVSFNRERPASMQVSAAPLLPNPMPSSILRPLAALEDRKLESAPAVVPAVPNFEGLRQELYRDLMNSIRADFERGG
jgi:hypothetical protein